MARRADAETRQTYLVEHYRPGLDVKELSRLAAHVRESVAELERKGKPALDDRPARRLLRVLDAASEKLVCEAYARAGIPFQPLSPAVTDDDS